MKRCLACGCEFATPGWACPACGRTPQRVDGHLAFAPELAASGPGFNVAHFAKLAQLEAQSFWFQSRNHRLIWALHQCFPDAKSLLEIGCGTGYVLQGLREAFPSLALSGSEIFSEGLTFAAERLPDVELFQMDARRIPFACEYDVVGAFDVLEHIEHDEEVLRQMYRTARPGGGIMLTVPQHRFLWSQADEEAMHQRRYASRELKEKVERAGFRLIRMTSFVTLLFPLMVMQRLSRRRPDSGYSAMQELAIGGVVNSTLKTIPTIERAMIRSGLSFSFGGSLFVAARKSAAS